MAEIKTLGLYHIVELIPTVRKTAGGILLPEVWHTNRNTGIVIDSGPGIDTPHGWILPHAQPDDIILFDSVDFKLFDVKTNRGFVKDTSICAWLLPRKQEEEEKIIPANGWVLVEHDVASEITSHGTIEIEVPEFWRRRPRSGHVIDYGPGVLLWNENSRGKRITVPEITGAELRPGSRVYWHEDAEALLVGRTCEKWILVDAFDLIAVKEED